jgi:rSAM/selenodomain-associated transferase 2
MKTSVIVPALNEERDIDRALLSVVNQRVRAELVVVDGGSRDNTVGIARHYAKVIMGRRGRSRQMNLGVQHSSGDVLVFLHADTELKAGYFEEVSKALEDPSVVGGYAPLTFDSYNSLLWIYSRFTMMKFRLFHYGDGAVFVRRSVFENLRGFRELPIMEDLDFLRRLQRAGRTVLLSTPVVTSARRFRKGGMIRNQARNVFIVSSFYLGVPPSQLARWYPNVRE